MKELMEELVEAMVASATDELGNGYPDWGKSNDGLWICTEQSRDPSRSRNGGAYYFYTYFDIRPDGVEVWDGSSCELVSDEERKDRSARLYPISLSIEGLERMAHLAEARALTMVAPEETLDPDIAAILDAAIAMFGQPKAGIGQLKAAVRAWEIRDLQGYHLKPA